MGADKLLGNGDMLFLYPGTSSLLRGQGTYLSDDEINAICDCASTGEQNFVNELMNIKVEDPAAGGPDTSRRNDDLYDSAIEVVIREGRGSVSLLQRALGIGYGRAARLVDYMEQDGIVGQYAGSQAREILLTMSEWEKMQGIEPEVEEEPANRVTRSEDWGEEEEEEELWDEEEEDVGEKELVDEDEEEEEEEYDEELEDEDEEEADEEEEKEEEEEPLPRKRQKARRA